MNIQGFTFHKDGFNLYDFNPDPNVIEGIQNMDKPIDEEKLKHTKTLLVNQYVDLSRNIQLYNETRNDLASDVNNDFYGKTLLFLPDKTDPIKTTEDVMKNDINTLMLQQNYIYIIGSITCATLLIGALIIGK